MVEIHAMIGTMLGPLAWFALVLLAACQGKHHDGGTGSSSGSGSASSPLHGARSDVTAWAGAAVRGAIGDLDGDHHAEIVLVDPSAIRVVDPSGRTIASAPVSAGIQKLVVADLDGDGRSEIVAGWGISREHRDAKARITVHRLDHGQLVEDTLATPATTRQEIAAIVPMLDQHAVLVAYFESQFMVTSAVARHIDQAWQLTPVATIRLATSYARGDLDGDGTIDLAVGRIYGDAKGVDGDAFVLAPAGARTPIPSTRGMRSLAIADADGDGHPEVFLGDGWHQNYAAQAHGMLSWSRYTAGAFTTELIEDTPGQFGLDAIVPATIDGHVVIVTAGNAYVRAFSHAGGRWRGATIGGIARDVVVGDLDGTPGDEILILGDRSELVTLHDSDFAP